MTVRRAHPQLRVPPSVMRAGARQLGRRCLDPALPWRVQRTRLDQLTRPFLLPRGTTVTEQTLGGVPAEVVIGRGTGRAADGGPLPRRRLLHRLGAHDPGLGRAPERPDGLPGGAARVPPGPGASLSGGTAGRPRGRSRACGRPGRAVGRLGGRGPCPSPWPCRCATRGRHGRLRTAVALARPGPRPPGRSGWCAGTCCSTPDSLDACAHAYAAPEAWADPSVSPSLAAHSGLPPLLIQAGTSELLAPDARTARRQRLGRRNRRDLHQVAGHVARLRAAAGPARRRRQRR